MAPSESESKRLELRKYPNRRYYDATRSRHLTLDEIRTLIQRGSDIRVTDARTKQDITAQVLTQIILELETSKLDTFPVPLLLRVIRMNDQLVKDFIDKYFNQALQSFINYQQQLEQHFRAAGGLPASFPLVSAWAKAMWQPFTSAFDTAPTEKPPAPEPAGAAGSAAESELRRELEELRAKLSKLKRVQPAGRGRKAPSRKPRAGS